MAAMTVASGAARADGACWLSMSNYKAVCMDTCSCMSGYAGASRAVLSQRGLRLCADACLET